MAISGRSSQRCNVRGRRRVDIGHFIGVEPRGGGWGVLGEYDRVGSFRRNMRGKRGWVDRLPGGDVVEGTV